MLAQKFIHNGALFKESITACIECRRAYILSICIFWEETIDLGEDFRYISPDIIQCRDDCCCLHDVSEFTNVLVKLFCSHGFSLNALVITASNLAHASASNLSPSLFRVILSLTSSDMNFNPENWRFTLEEFFGSTRRRPRFTPDVCCRKHATRARLDDHLSHISSKKSLAAFFQSEQQFSFSLQQVLSTRFALRFVNCRWGDSNIFYHTDSWAIYLVRL